MGGWDRIKQKCAWCGKDIWESDDMDWIIVFQERKERGKYRPACKECADLVYGVREQEELFDEYERERRWIWAGGRYSCGWWLDY